MWLHLLLVHVCAIAWADDAAGDIKCVFVCPPVDKAAHKSELRSLSSCDINRYATVYFFVSLMQTRAIACICCWYGCTLHVCEGDALSLRGHR
jgi:hypothetical protein